MVNTYLKSMKFLAQRMVMLAALASVAFSTLAQTVEIPNGNPLGGTRRNPLGVYFGYERSIMVYDKTEINGGAGLPAGSSITNLEFYFESQNCPPVADYNCKIYLKERAPATLATTTFPNAILGAQLVFNGLIPASNWSSPGTYVSIALQNCFIFQNNNNSIEVLVETNYALPPTSDPNGWFADGTCGTFNSIMFRSSNTTNANFISWAADNNPPTGNGTPTTINRPNIRMTYSPAPNCAALPPMTPQASATSVCSGVPFTVILPTLPCVGGLTFQWQLNNVTSGGWINIAGATNTSLTATQSEQTSYRCVVTCTFNSTSITTFTVTVNQNNYLSCYCASSANFSGDTDIGNVTMTRVSNGSTIINNPVGGCTPVTNNPAATGTYTNYTGLGPYNVIQGENYGMNLCQITQGGTFFSAFFNVFVDWNADGFFDVSNERALSGGPTSSGTPTASGVIPIPFSSDTGITRMRVVLREFGSAADPACGSFAWGEVEDYNINIVPGLICNLTAPGTAQSSFPSVCVGQTLTLSISGNTTVGSFQTWQWQVSTTGSGGPYTNITGATYIPYKTTQTVDSWYRCVLICNAGAPQTTGFVYVPMSPPTQCYCVPVHPAGCALATITNVTLNTLNNTTGCTSGNGPSYTQYPVAGATTTSVTQNSSYSLSVTTTGNNAIISVWIDYNRNGVFETTEWYQPSINNPPGTAAVVPITIPATSGTGLTGMRVRSRGAGNPNGAPDACTVFGSGEAEDYFITIIPFVPPNCSTLTVAGTPVTTTAAAPCSGTNFTLTLSAAPLTGMLYQWQSGPTATGPWTNIAGATSSSYTGSQTVTTYYQCLYSCSFNPGYAPSASILVTNTSNFWKGVTSDWADAVNWCSGTPRGTDDVLISRTQPGVANPYFTPIVAVSDTVLAKNLTIAINDSMTLYNDTLNSVTINQSTIVNGKFIMRSSVSDTCCLGTYNGIATNLTYQPFRTNIAENRLQMLYISNDFASLPSLSSNDQVTYLLMQLSGHPFLVAPSGSFQNVKVSYGWVPTTTLEYSSSDPFPTPYTVTTIPSFSLIGKVTNDTIMIPTTNFKWRTDSNLVLQICYDTPTGQAAAGGTPTYAFRVNSNLGRRSTLFASVVSSAGGLDGCGLTSISPGVSTGFADARPNVKFIFGRKSKKLNIPIGNDLLVNSTGTFISALANITVSDSVNNQGIMNIDTTTFAVANAFLNSGTFDMSYASSGPNKFSSLSVGGLGITNSGIFTAGKSPVTVTGTGLTNSGTFNAGTNTISMSNTTSTFSNTGAGVYNASTSLFAMSGANFNNSATYNGGTGVLFMNSALAQSIGGTSPLTLYRLRLNKGISNANLVNINNAAVTVTDSINLLKGSIDLNGNTLSFTNPAVLSFRSVLATSGYIISAATNFSSKLKWTIGTNTGLHIFPFYKLPLTPTESNGFVPVEFANVAGAADNVGDITVATYPTVAANTPLPPNVWHINNATGLQNSANMANRFWYVERSTPAPGTGNTTMAFTVVNSEKEAATVFSTMRVQPYYTYSVASPPPLVRASWLSAPASQATTTGGLGTPFRTLMTGYTWPVALGSFNPWASGTTTLPLPIELIQFDATLKGTDATPYVELNWATASEEENDYFTVERTIDFNQVSEIDRVPSLGNSAMIQKYSTLDNSPVMGRVNYYRLKQTDINGNSTDNDRWVPVNVGVRDVFNISYIKSNDKLEVVFEYDNESNINVVVTDMTGREMFRSTGFGANPGLNILPIDSKGWADGVYLISLRDKDRQVSHKIFY
jgi:GEVED domain